MKVKNILKSSVFLMGVILFAKILGMLRDVVLANYFGTSNISDAYLICVSVTNFLFAFVGHSLSTAFLPMYKKVAVEKGEARAQRYMNSLICCALAIATITVVIIFIFSKPIVNIFAPGFDYATVDIAASFLRWSAFSLYFMVIINVWGGYLQSKENFIIPASVSVPRNVVIMIFIWLAALLDVRLLGVGLLLAYFAELLLLLPFVLKKGYRPQFRFDIKSVETKETLYLVLPILAGVGVSQINHIIDRSLASLTTVGGLSALTYASILNNAVQEVLVTGIITILFAKCSSWVAEGKHDFVRDKLKQTLNTMIFLLLPASVGIITCSESIVKWVLCRGAFDELSLKMTSEALRCYTLGLLFLAVRDTLVKVFYAYKRTKTTTAVSTISIAINVLLNFVLIKFIGLNGLAIATSVSAVFNATILYILLRRKIGDFGIKSSTIVAIKTMISSAVMSVVVLGVQFLTASFSGFASLMLCIIAGIIVYLVIAFILRVEPLMTFYAKLRKNAKP